MSSAAIRIAGLRALGRHGVLTHEQEQAQPFEVDITIETDIDRAARTDDLRATVDYGLVVASAVEIVENDHFSLLEALAGAIADDVLRREGVTGVTVEVRKLRPPLPAQLESVGVRLHRSAT